MLSEQLTPSQAFHRNLSCTNPINGTALKAHHHTNKAGGSKDQPLTVVTVKTVFKPPASANS
ncbi:hypothetical protein DOY81_002627 [Sarcophaga bullata]|nr:hypothetical protein DOY81_002627 [Sarcophaga bullata]